MYLCICNAVTVGKARETLDGLDCRSVRELRASLGFESSCGRCTDELRQLLECDGCGLDQQTTGEPACKVTKTSFAS